MLKAAELGFYDDADPGEPTTGLPRLSVTTTEADILSALGAGRDVSEIGTGLGVSTRALARFATSVVTHDIDPWVHEHVWPELLTLKVGCVKERDSMALAMADLVFIDADHSAVAVAADIELARSFHGTPLIVCHDARYASVRQAIPEDWLFLDTEHGLAIGR